MEVNEPGWEQQEDNERRRQSEWSEQFRLRMDEQLKTLRKAWDHWVKEKPQWP